MNDQVTLPASDPQAVTPTVDPQKSPLDLLEEILGQSKTDAASASERPTEVPATPVAPVQPDKPPALSLEEIQAMEAQQHVQDEAQAEATLAEIKTVSQEPQAQAVAQTDEAHKQEEATHADAQQGFEITQITHTKV